MKAYPSSQFVLLFAMAVSPLLAPSPAFAQNSDSGVKEAYFRAVGEHFDVPHEEVLILGERNLAPDEVPVVLFLAARAGVSPDALVGLRRANLAWRDVASRFGLGTRIFHLTLPDDALLGLLSRAYDEFRGLPSREWHQIQLEDTEIVALVNMRVLSEQVGLPTHRILQVRGETDSFMASYPILIRR